MKKHCYMGLFCALALVAATAAPAFAAVHTVDQTGLAFVPADIVVQQGDTINWVWSGGGHTVTSGLPAPDCTTDGKFDMPLNSGATTATWMVPGAETPGVIQYHCTPHCMAGMAGTITVVAAPVPAVSTVGMAVMVVLMVAAAAIVFQVRRRSSVRHA